MTHHSDGRHHNTARRKRQTRAVPLHPIRPRDPFWDLVATARRLQAPGGCAWDRAQTVSTLLPYLIEETWEVFETIRSRRAAALTEELGDVLYTVLFMALKAEQRGAGSLDQLLTKIRQKMVRRHPHVFAGARAPSPSAAYRQWQASKRRERAGGPSPTNAFRKRLVAQWDALIEPRSPSATPRRGKGQSSGRG